MRSFKVSQMEDSRGIILLFALSLLPYTSSAQSDSSGIIQEQRPKIEIIARPLKDSILLRWAPNNSLLWEEANKTGYVLERITMLRDGQLLTKPEHKIITASPFKPLPLEKWENAAKRNKYAAVAAQALYGETFDIKGDAKYDLYAVITKVRERDTRFSFALFAADQSPEVARLSGLWFTDTEVKSNEKYLYRVFAAKTVQKTDTGLVYTATDEYEPLPKPIDLKAELYGHKVNLSWNYLYFEHIYTAYIVERSDDGGKTFRSITDEPIVNFIPTGKPNPELYFKMDSLPQYNYKYYYRVKGINSFGETGQPSDAITAEAHKAISFIPYITETKTIDNRQVYLKWEFPPEKNGEISAFKLSRSSSPKKGFKYIDNKITAEQREFTDNNPAINNYYIISAINSYGDEIRSVPVLVQLIDSVPPDPPVNLKGSIDTTGRVKLYWRANKEEDIYGYRIYRANQDDQEYSQVTVAPVTDTCFTDSITLKTLTRKIFYKVMSIDMRQNHSAFSQSLELKKPDHVAPVAPVFQSIKSSAEGVYLEWINSSSTDVKACLLYRSIPKSKEWKLIAAFDAKDSVTSYVDRDADSTAYNRYTLIAKDYDNLESDPAIPVEGKKIDTGVRPGIGKIFVDVEREKEQIKLGWKQPQGTVHRYMIYRAKGTNELALYTSIDGDTNFFTDRNLQPNSVYQYSIRIMYADGGESPFSEKTTVKY